MTPEGREQRIESVDNAGYFSKDAEIAKLSDADMVNLSINKRTEYLDHLVGKKGNGIWGTILNISLGTDEDWEKNLTRVGKRDEISVIPPNQCYSPEAIS